MSDKPMSSSDDNFSQTNSAPTPDKTASSEPNTSTTMPMPRFTTRNAIIRDVTKNYLDLIDLDNPPDSTRIENDLVANVNVSFKIENQGRDTRNKISLLQQPTFTQVAMTMIHLHNVVKIAPAGKNTDPDYDMLAVYCNSGQNKGIYVSSEDYIHKVARLYDHEISIMSLRDVFGYLKEFAPRVHVCTDPDLIAVNNGIFNYKTKELIPFSPDLVFLSKSYVDYDPNATSPILNAPDGTTWEVEEWMESLSDDPEIVHLLWEIIGAIIRPHVRWNKSAWFYSHRGNNGKGTLVELMRNLLGPGAYASIPLADMGKDFMLEALTRAKAIIVDENDVGTFIDKAANLKALITNDVIMINRKFKQPISYQFWGFMVQCLNEFPRIKDKSESFYRRQLFVPFTKCFTGSERKYIKDSFVSHPDVLKYVLKRVLNMDYYELSSPLATRQVLEEYKMFNDPIRSFWDEYRSRFVWDLLPFSFLYDAYRSWFGIANPSGSPVGRNVFIKDLISLLDDDNLWFCDDQSKVIRSKSRMDTAEPLIEELDLRRWMNPSYQGKDINKMCRPRISTAYRGIQRYGSHVIADNNDNDNSDD